MSGGNCLYPKDYIKYLIHFHGDRDYFECHEILEEYWKQTDPGNKESIWVGLILMAVSAYHHRRGNFSGAKRTMEKSKRIFELNAESFTAVGLDYQQLFSLVSDRVEEIQAKVPYRSFSLPINDPVLLKQCSDKCKEQGLIWESESDLSNNEIVHRHKLRDRSNVIDERNKAIAAKKAAKN